MHIAYSGVARVSAARDGSWICRPSKFCLIPQKFFDDLFFEATLCLASKSFKIKMVKSYFIYGNVLKLERYTVINVMRNTTVELTILLKLLAFKKCAFAFS